jgi:hypothetical protein
MSTHNLKSVYLFPPGFGARRFLECKEKLFPFIENMCPCEEYDSAVDAIRKHKPEIVFIALYHGVEDMSALMHEAGKAATSVCYIIPASKEKEHKDKYKDSHYMMTSYKDDDIRVTLHRLRNEVMIKRIYGGVPKGILLNWMQKEIKVRHDKDAFQKKLISNTISFVSTKDGKCTDVSFMGGCTDHHGHSIKYVMNDNGTNYLFQNHESEIIVLAQIAIYEPKKRLLFLTDYTEHFIVRERQPEFNKIKGGTWWVK